MNSLVADPIKHYGRTYTPKWVVDLILDTCLGKNLQNKAICDPACGDGNFFVPLVERICSKLQHSSAKNRYYQTLEQLTGLDIDKTALAKCQTRLDAVVRKNGIKPINWNLQLKDALDVGTWDDWTANFDYVIGNPPYVRIQNLEKHRRVKIKYGDWHFMRGACDLYVLFFDLGLRLLNKKGKLAFITPNSWLRTHSAAKFRAYLRNNHEIVSLFDFGQYQVFQGKTTYTAITTIKKEKTGKLPNVVPVKKCTGINQGRPQFDNGYAIQLQDEKWYPMLHNQRKRIKNAVAKSIPLSQLANIHVGIQTLADDVFILPKERLAPSGNIAMEPAITRPIYKASVMKNGKDVIPRVIIYPYHNNGTLLPEAEFKESYPKAYSWLFKHKARLLARDKHTFPPHKWYAFGRAVSLTSGFGEKILTSGMNPAPNFQYCNEAESLFYAGYCIKPRIGINVNKLLKELNSSFMDYFIRVTSKPYRNGWFSYAKAFIENFPVSKEVLSHGN